MKCEKCNKEGVVKLSYTKRVYCKKHFRELIEKRVRKDLRQKKLININETYNLVFDETPESELLLDLMKSIFNNRLKIIITKKIPDHSEFKTIVPDYLEVEASKEFEEFISSKSFLETKKNKEENNNIIKPLISVSAEEIFFLTGRKPDFKKRNVNELLLSINDFEPNTFFSVRKVFERINDFY